MFRLFLVNFNYHVDGSFARLEDAIEKARSVGFEVNIEKIDQGYELVAFVSPISGVRMISRAAV